MSHTADRESGQVVARALRPYGTSIFTEMTDLAITHGAVNLSQGFPDFDGPEEIRREVLPRKGAIIQTKSVRSTGSDELFAQREAQRCLQCSYICNKCVEVCPNRANVVISVPVEAGFGQDEQIVHIDALCNECGNCATFCPWNGKPYKDKFTVFNLREDFDNSENDGFLIEGESAVVRLNGAVRSLPLNEEGSIESDELDSRVSAMIETIVHKHAYLLGEVDR